jgi:uncharacterized protein YcbX
MSTVGNIESLWRYPVRSMRGEELAEAFVGYAGVYGDRLFAFKSSARPTEFPYLTGREQREMLLYRPRFRHPEKAAKPPNLAEVEALAPGVSPLYADAAEFAVDVETPSGEVLAVDDPALIRLLAEGMADDQTLTLLRSERALTDCCPVSLFSIETVRQLGDEIGASLDKGRFRANVYLDLKSVPGFAEDAFVGRKLRLGSKVVVAVLKRDSRCKMITIDPDTLEPNGAVLRRVSRAHDGMAGIYAAVLVEGMVHPGDAIELLS